MPKPFDATTRFLIERHPEDWLRLLGVTATEIETIDSETLDTDLSTVSAQADRVFRLKAPTEILQHLELESGHHGNHTPDALLRYNVLLSTKYKLSVQTAVVLLKPGAGSPELTGLLEKRRASGEIYLTFCYDVVWIWDLPVDALLTGGLGTLPLASIAKMHKSQLPEVVQKIQDRIETEAGPDAGELLTATRILMGLRYTRGSTNRLLKGVRKMRESVTYQEIVEEGVLKGLTQGRVEGRIEGLKEGEQTIALALAERRFGPAPAAAREKIAAITSQNRLIELAASVSTVESWAEFLKRYLS